MRLTREIKWFVKDTELLTKEWNSNPGFCDHNTCSFHSAQNLSSLISKPFLGKWFKMSIVDANFNEL